MLEGDSIEYEILADTARAIKGVPGMTAEIGVRKGWGSKVIIDALMDNQDYGRTHLCIDPYGSIDFVHGAWHHPTRGTVHFMDKTGQYSNALRAECMIDLLTYTQQMPVNLLFFTLTDTEFFKRYGDGVPIFEGHPTLMLKYAMVHVDGEHSLQAVVDAIQFFHERVSVGGAIVLDDIERFDYPAVKAALLASGWDWEYQGERKASFRKTSLKPLAEVVSGGHSVPLDDHLKSVLHAGGYTDKDGVPILSPGFVGEAGE